MATRHIGISVKFHAGLSFSLVWTGTDNERVFTSVVSQKQKNHVSLFLVVIRCEELIRESGNAELVLFFIFWKRKHTSCEQLQLLPLLLSRRALPVPGRGALQLQAITDRDVYLTNVLKTSVYFKRFLLFLCVVYFLCMWFCLGRYNLAKTFEYCTFFWFWPPYFFFPCNVAFFILVFKDFLFFKHQCSSTLGRLGGNF